MVSSLEVSSQLSETVAPGGLAQGSPVSSSPGFRVLFAAQQGGVPPGGAETAVPSVAIAPFSAPAPDAQEDLSGFFGSTDSLNPGGAVLAQLVAGLSLPPPMVRPPAEKLQAGALEADAVSLLVATGGARCDLSPVPAGGDRRLQDLVPSCGSQACQQPAVGLSAMLMASPRPAPAAEPTRAPSAVGGLPANDLAAMIAHLLTPGSLAQPAGSPVGIDAVESPRVTEGEDAAQPVTAVPEPGPYPAPMLQAPASGSVGSAATLDRSAEAQETLPLTAPAVAHAVSGPVRRTLPTISGTARQDLSGDVTQASDEAPRATTHESLLAGTHAAVVATPTDREPVPGDPPLSGQSLLPSAWQPPASVPLSTSLHPAAPAISAVSEPRRLAPLARDDSLSASGPLPVIHPAELPAGALGAPTPPAPVVAPSANQAVAQLPNPVERIVAHQVVRAVARHPEGGDRSLVIRLTPPELGTVRVEIQERDGQLTARLHADDPAVRQALDRLLPQMRSDLRLSDAPLQQITVSSGTATDQGFDGRGFDGRGAQAHPDAGRQSGRQRRGDRPVFSLDAEVAAVTAPVALPGRTRVASGRVDALA